MRSLGWFFSIIMACCAGCRQSGGHYTKLDSLAMDNDQDTVVLRAEISNELAGATYRTRALSYSIVANNDTSTIGYIFTQSKEAGRVTIHFPHIDGGKSYREKLSELEKILPYAAKDFRMDSLSSISLGRLVDNGDIAIDITDEFIRKGGRNATNAEVSRTMKDSRLANDFNRIFKPYRLMVREFSTEKCHFTSGYLLRDATVERETSAIPDRIIDCVTWVAMKPLD
jgi:hypothetical protein